jgi:hypothetical protein
MMPKSPKPETIAAEVPAARWADDVPVPGLNRRRRAAELAGTSGVG